MLVGDGENIKSLSYVENIVDATIFWDARAARVMGVYHYWTKPDLKSIEITQQVYRSLGKTRRSSASRLGFGVPAGAALRHRDQADGQNLPVSSARIRSSSRCRRSSSAEGSGRGFQIKDSTDAGPDGAIADRWEVVLGRGPTVQEGRVHLPPPEVQSSADGQSQRPGMLRRAVL